MFPVRATPPDGEPPVETWRDTEKEKIVSWRREQFTGMGFRGAALDLLVTSPVDLHMAERLLSLGATHPQVLAILV